MVRAVFESTQHGKVTVLGTYVPAERETGTPAYFEIEQATARDVDVSDLLSDEDVEAAQEALFSRRHDLRVDAHHEVQS